jgi:hypothetical protein
VGTKHATVGGERLKFLAATFAGVDDDADVSWHLLGCLMAAMWASNGRLELRFRHAFNVALGRSAFHDRTALQKGRSARVLRAGFAPGSGSEIICLACGGFSANADKDRTITT